MYGDDGLKRYELCQKKDCPVSGDIWSDKETTTKRDVVCIYNTRNKQNRFSLKKKHLIFHPRPLRNGQKGKKSVFLYKPNIVRSNREILSVSIHIYSRVLQQITLSKNRKCLLIQTVWTQACQCCIKLRRPSQTAIFVALRRLKIVRAFAACHNGINKFHETALKWPSSFRRKYVNLLSLMPA